ncbi:MAG: helix-turn-helix transcriptional regulator [Victivallales bacterium]|jgi:plasmid maintenance system antidote protein, XRE family
MLAIVEIPRVELALSGSKKAVTELLEYLRDRYPITVLSNMSHERSGDTEVPGQQPAPGQLLQNFRLKRGLSQRLLAEKSGIGQTVLSAYENGRRPLSRKAAIKIGKALGEDPSQFFPSTAG